MSERALNFKNEQTTKLTPEIATVISQGLYINSIYARIDAVFANLPVASSHLDEMEKLANSGDPAILLPELNRITKLVDQG